MNETTYELAVELRHQLHQNAELSNEEVKTKQLLINFLQQNTQLEIKDRGSWFYAVYRCPDGGEVGAARTPGPRNIAFRADFDAIPVEDEICTPYRSLTPGVGHKCGHDGHAASLAAFAVEVNRLGAKNNIFFLFQHAEEVGAGARECVKVIAEEQIDEIFAFHNSSGFDKGLVVLKNGITNCASEGMEISFVGTPAHASQPEHGKNPALAVTAVVQALSRLSDPAQYQGLVLCTVIQIDVGERAFGCSASRGKLLLTLRAEFEHELQHLQTEIEKLVVSECEKYDLTYNFTYHDIFPETINWPESVDRLRQACIEANVPWFQRSDFQRGSEDFGYYTKKIPGAYFWIGNGKDHPAIHTAAFDFPDSHIKIACQVFGKLAGICE